MTPEAIQDLKSWVSRNLDNPIAQTVAQLLIEHERHTLTLNLNIGVTALTNPEASGMFLGELLRSLSPEDAEAMRERLLNAIDHP